MLPVQRFQNFITQHRLFEVDNTLLVAVSGGRDSVLLVHLLKAAGYQFGIAHCNFQLRGAESKAEQDFTTELAKQLGVPFYTTDFDTQIYAIEHNLSIQMAARELRYQWFEDIRHSFGYSHIAVAHHQNDSVETILLNLTRGTGIAGLHGILPVNGLIVRPMMFLSRDEIDHIIDEELFPYVEDSSNSSVKYARNKIRHQVIPVLRELNPRLEQTFNNNMERFRELEMLLNHQTEKLRNELFVPYGDEFRISVDALKKLQPQRLLMFELFKNYGFTENVIDDLIGSLDKHSGRIFDAPGYRMVLDRDKLILIKPKTERPEPVLIQQTTHDIEYGGYKLTLLHDDSPLIVRDNPMAVSIDAALLVYPLILRGWNEGDYFYPIGMKGKKKLSDFFVNEKIPLHQKDMVPVLVNGNADVVWVGGYRPDDRYKVTAHTKKVIIFELYKLN